MDKWNESLAKQLQNTLDEDQLTQCMRCGFCLPSLLTLSAKTVLRQLSREESP